MSHVQVNATYEYLDAIFARCPNAPLSTLGVADMQEAKDACRDLIAADKKELFSILQLEITKGRGGWFAEDAKTVHNIVFYAV